MQILERVLQRRNDALVVGRADPLGVAAEEKRQVRRCLPHDQPRLEVAQVPGHHVLPIDLGDEAADLEDQLAQPGADPAAELEQVADQHPGITDDLRIPQPLAEVGHVAPHPRADRRHQLGDLGLGIERPFVDRLVVRFGRPERVVEIVERVLFRRRRELRAVAGDQLVDALHGRAHNRRQLFPEREGVTALLLVGLVAHQVDVGELEDRFRRGQQEPRHPLAKVVLEPPGDFQEPPLDGHVGPIFGGKHRGAVRGHRRTC